MLLRSDEIGTTGPIWPAVWSTPVLENTVHTRLLAAAEILAIYRE